MRPEQFSRQEKITSLDEKIEKLDEITLRISAIEEFPIRGVDRNQEKENLETKAKKIIAEIKELFVREKSIALSEKEKRLKNLLGGGADLEEVKGFFTAPYEEEAKKFSSEKSKKAAA